MDKKYIAPDIELQNAVLFELICQSVGGTIEDFKDDGEFVW